MTGMLCASGFLVPILVGTLSTLLAGGWRSGERWGDCAKRLRADIGNGRKSAFHRVCRQGHRKMKSPQWLNGIKLCTLHVSLELHRPPKNLTLPLQELESRDGRIRYELIEGSGPAIGWVTPNLRGKDCSGVSAEWKLLQSEAEQELLAKKGEEVQAGLLSTLRCFHGFAFSCFLLSMFCCCMVFIVFMPAHKYDRRDTGHQALRALSLFAMGFGKRRC